MKVGELKETPDPTDSASRETCHIRDCPSERTFISPGERWSGGTDMTMRQLHMQKAANEASNRALRHTQAATAIEDMEKREDIRPGGGGNAHRRATEQWLRAATAITYALQTEEGNGISNTGDGK